MTADNNLLCNWPMHMMVFYILLQLGSLDRACYLAQYNLFSGKMAMPLTAVTVLGNVILMVMMILVILMILAQER